MAEALDQSALERWRNAPTEFIREVLRNPETGDPFELLSCELRFLEHAYRTDELSGRLLYPEQCYSGPKKTGKTTFDGVHGLTLTLVFGGRFAETYCVANDLEQARGRVFEAIRKIVEASPYLQREAQVVANKITFPATGATITAISSDYASAAGANPTLSIFDELWGATSERSHRLWDEMIPVPTRKISARLTSTYAGFSGESDLLEKLYARGLAQPEIGPDLRAGNGLLFYWTHEPQAPWQTPEWLEQMRSQLRPNAYLRMIENRFVTSEQTFIDMSWWDACCIARPVLADPSMSVWVAVDASTKRDSTAIVVVTFDKATKKPRLVWHKIINPTKDEPIDFEQHVEEVLLGLKSRFRVRGIYFDPFQMQATSQRMKRAGLNMIEFPQTTANITAASQNLYELIKSEGIVVYPDADIRLAIQRSVAVENPRGWRITKEKASHKIDVVVALGMAALAAVKKSGDGQIHTYVQGAELMPDGTHRRINQPERTRLNVVRVDENGNPWGSPEAQATRDATLKRMMRRRY
jgi:terminase large subunit-like protein